MTNVITFGATRPNNIEFEADLIVLLQRHFGALMAGPASLFRCTQVVVKPGLVEFYVLTEELGDGNASAPVRVLRPQPDAFAAWDKQLEKDAASGSLDRLFAALDEEVLLWRADDSRRGLPAKFLAGGEAVDR